MKSIFKYNTVKYKIIISPRERDERQLFSIKEESIKPNIIEYGLSYILNVGDTINIEELNLNKLIKEKICHPNYIEYILVDDEIFLGTEIE